MKRKIPGKRRILSAALAAVLSLSIIPAEFIKVRAAENTKNTVEYHRELPEVAILNQYNCHANFYNLLAGEPEGSDKKGTKTKYPMYNGMRLFGSTWDYSPSFGKDEMSKSLSWNPKIDGKAPSFADSTLKKIMSVDKNLSVRLSVRYRNNLHQHTWGSIFKRQGVRLASYLNAYAKLGGRYSNPTSGFVDIYTENHTDGDNWVSLGKPYNDTENNLTITRSSVEYKEGTKCTCQGASATEFLMTFKDDRPPSITNVYYSDDNKNWQHKNSASSDLKALKTGDTIYIKLTCDEPIRFADDSAKDKEKLYLKLNLGNGKQSEDDPKAYLYKLDGNDIYFKYTVPSTISEEINVLSLDTDSLFKGKGKDNNYQINLVHLARKTGGYAFQIEGKGNDGELGFTKSDCYITDLAGNSLTRGNISHTGLSIDTITPYVKNISYNLTVNNDDVKEAKANDPNEKDEKDASDTNLGVGDEVVLNISMNEILNLDLPYIDRNGYSYLAEYGVAKTNIKVPKGYTPSGHGIGVSADNYITVRTHYFTPPSTKVATALKQGNTVFTTYGIKITEGMTIEVDSNNNPKAELRVTEFDLSEFSTKDPVNKDKKNVTDMSGNIIVGGKLNPSVDANSNPPRLDTVPPIVTEVSGGGYTPEISGGSNGFRYVVEIKKDENNNSNDDVPGVTPVVPAMGYFTLNHSGDEAVYEFEYAVTASAKTDGIEWKSGATGIEYKFIQNATTYFHFRAKSEDENGKSISYENFGKLKLTIKAKDYAGNVATIVTPDDKIEWYMDNTPPSIEVGETKRAVSGNNGIVETKVVMKDKHGLKTGGFQYAWHDSEETEPTTWETGTITETENGIEGVAKATFGSDQKFSKYLWVKATDGSNNPNSDGNSDVKCFGLYEYDLTAAEYSLDQSSNITEKADIKITSIGKDDAVVFIYCYDKVNGLYAVKVFKDGGFEKGKTIFEYDGWVEYKITESSTPGIWSAEPRGTLTSQYDFSHITTGKYHGDLNITVLAGKAAGLHFDGYEHLEGYLSSIGDDSYKFVSTPINLRVAGTNPWFNYSRLEDRVDPADYIRLSCKSDITAVNRKVCWDSTLLKSLAGVVFEINVIKDNYGWNCEDLDTNGSRLVLKNRLNGLEKEVQIGSFTKNADRTYGQRVIISGEYETGLYDVLLRLKSVTGETHDIEYKPYVDGNYMAMGGIAVDATKPKNKIAISSIKVNENSLYDHDYLKINSVYGEKEYVKDGVIELPVSAGYFNMETLSPHVAPSNIYSITFKNEEEEIRGELKDGDDLHSYSGQYYIEAWNAADEYKDKKVRFDALDSNMTTVSNHDNCLIANELIPANGFTTLETYKENDNFVYLKPDVENVVCFRKVYSNTTVSETQSVRIKPVTNHLMGNLSINKEQKQLEFNITSDLDTSLGAQVYALAYQNGQDYKKGEGELIELKNAGTKWICPLVDGGAIYRVFTINASGSVWSSPKETEFASQRAPWFEDVEYTANPDGDGTYSLEFSLKDDIRTAWEDGIKLNFDFNEEYCAENLNLTLSKENLIENQSYVWTPGEYSNTGIYSIETSYFTSERDNSDHLNIVVKGAAKKQNAETQTPQKMKLRVTAQDAFGHVATCDSGEQNVTYAMPKVTSTNLEYSGIKICFNQPVYPVESWAWKEKDGYDENGNRLSASKEWIGAFPVSHNGEHEINFKDVFGNNCTTTFTTDAFTWEGYDRGFYFDLSETELTEDPVYLTAKMDMTNHKENTGLLVMRANPGVDEAYTIIPEGNYDGTFFDPNHPGRFDTSKPWNNEMKTATSTPRTVKLENSIELDVGSYDDNYILDTLAYKCIFAQRVYVDNIIDGPPKASLRWYFPYMGKEFSQEELDKYIEKNGGNVEIQGEAQATYITNRKTTPADNTQTVFYLTPQTQNDTYTFSFKDQLNKTASITAALPEGITLVEPPVERVDAQPPYVSTEVSGKVWGKYVVLDNFLDSETKENIKAIFESTEATQGYCLTVNANDESGFDISVDNGNGEVPDGVELLGNIILVNKPSNFNVVVTDKSPLKNSTTYSITEDMFDNIDTTPPTVALSTVANEMYKRKVVGVFTDKNDKGKDTTFDENGKLTIDIQEPNNIQRVEENKYEYEVSNNGKVEFVFYDMVGNRAVSQDSSIDVSGIDTNPPKLKKTWSPPFSYTDENGEVYVDYEWSSQDWTNQNVTAVITSDKPIYDLILNIEAMETKLMEKGFPVVENPYIVTDYDGNSASILMSPEVIRITFLSNYKRFMDFKATAPNGKMSEEVDVYFAGDIDKKAPEATVNKKFIHKKKSETEDYTLPYEVEVTIVPNESVISQNYGTFTTYEFEPGETQTNYTTYREDYPLVLKFKENGTYKVNLSDEAGNVTIVPVVITELDNTPPKITLGERTETAKSTNVPITVDEDCTLTANGTTEALIAGETKNLVFIDNGSFSVVATDGAGNSTEKVIVVGNIDKILPSISFETSTVYVLQDCEEAALTKELEKGYSIWDDKTPNDKLKFNMDKSDVKLNESGTYKVAYSVEDEAGNVKTVDRFVQVIGKDTVCATVDGNMILPEGTAVISAGEHNIKLTNCDEPFTVKARKGIYGSGQMKYLSGSSVKFDDDGNFKVTSKGYYTLLVTTQSRKRIRILLCVE